MSFVTRGVPDVTKAQVFRGMPWAYQTTDTKTLWHYKFDATGWETLTFRGASVSAIRDYGPLDLHLLNDPSWFVGSVTFDQPAPSALTRAVEFASGSAISTPEMEYGSTRPTVAAGEDFILAYTFKREDAWADPNVQILDFANPGIGGADHYAMFYNYTGNPAADLWLGLDTYSPDVQFYTYAPGAADLIVPGVWNQLVVIYRRGVDLPIVLLNGARLTVAMNPFLVSSTTTFTSVGALEFKGWHSVNGATYFLTDNHMTWGEVWASAGTTPKVHF